MLFRPESVNSRAVVASFSRVRPKQRGGLAAYSRTIALTPMDGVNPGFQKQYEYGIQAMVTTVQFIHGARINRDLK